MTDEATEEYPLGGMIEPYDIEKEKQIIDEADEKQRLIREGMIDSQDELV